MKGRGGARRSPLGPPQSAMHGRHYSMSGGSRTPTQGRARERQPSGSWNPGRWTRTPARYDKHCWPAHQTSSWWTPWRGGSMPWQPSERAGQARQRSSQGCDYWKSYASSKRWLPRSTGCKPGRLVKDGRAGHTLSRSPHGTTSRRIPPAGATGPGAGWCSWPFAASCTSGGWATRPASRGSGYQCRGSLHSGTKSATRKSPHTPSRLFLRHGGHISGNTDLDTCKYDSRWSQEEGRCYKRCSSKWCNIGTSQKLPGTASRSWGPCPGGMKAESCEGCKSGAAGGHKPGPNITGRHRQDGHYQQKSTCHGRWGTADGWPEMWRGDWSNPSHSGPRMHGRQCRRSQQPCSLGGTGTTPNHRETTLTPPAPARQMRG